MNSYLQTSDKLINSNKCLKIERKNPKIKTYKNWKGNLDEYLEIGDIVDNAMVEYFINVLPPVTMNKNMIQMGETYSYVDGKKIYSTLIKKQDKWIFAGYCHRGQVKNKKI